MCCNNNYKILIRNYSLIPFKRHTVDLLRTLAKGHNIRVYCDYRNAWVTRKKKTILLGVLRDCFGFFSRGYNDEEALEKLVSRLAEERAFLILTLDGVHLLPEADLRGLLRISEQYGASCRISLILISQPTDWQVVFPQRIANTITLTPYTFDEMHRILESQVQLAFKSGVVSANILHTITELAYQINDVRYALKILYRAGCAADQTHTYQLTSQLIDQIL